MTRNSYQPRNKMEAVRSSKKRETKLMNNEVDKIDKTHVDKTKVDKTQDEVDKMKLNTDEICK